MIIIGCIIKNKVVKCSECPLNNKSLPASKEACKILAQHGAIKIYEVKE